MTALFAASAKVALRHGAFPSSIGVLLVLAALAQPFAVGTMLTDSGAFAGDGVLGLFLPVASPSRLAISGALVASAARRAQCHSAPEGAARFVRCPHGSSADRLAMPRELEGPKQPCDHTLRVSRS